MMFGNFFEGFNDDQYSCYFKRVKESRGHQHWLKSLVNPLTKADRVDYVTYFSTHPQVLADGVKFLLEYFSTFFNHMFHVICLVYNISKLHLVC